MVYVSSDFTLDMLPAGACEISTLPVEASDVARALAAGAVSVVEHEEAASTLAAMLDCPISCSRYKPSLERGDELYVCQHRGDATFEYLLVSIVNTTPTGRPRLTALSGLEVGPLPAERIERDFAGLHYCYSPHCCGHPYPNHVRRHPCPPAAA